MDFMPQLTAIYELNKSYFKVNSKNLELKNWFGFASSKF
jgi:hypothetical protein